MVVPQLVAASLESYVMLDTQGCTQDGKVTMKQVQHEGFLTTREIISDTVCVIRSIRNRTRSSKIRGVKTKVIQRANKKRCDR